MASVTDHDGGNVATEVDVYLQQPGQTRIGGCAGTLGVLIGAELCVMIPR